MPDRIEPMHKKKRFVRLVSSSDPLVVRREFDLLFMGTYAIFAAWAIQASHFGLETVTLAMGETFNQVWTLTIAVLSVLAFIAAASIWFRTKVSQITKKRLELVLAILLSCTISVYPIYLFIAAVMGDENRAANATLSLLYLLIIGYRIRHLVLRIKSYGKP